MSSSETNSKGVSTSDAISTTKSRIFSYTTSPTYTKSKRLKKKSKTDSRTGSKDKSGSLSQSKDDSLSRTMSKCLFCNESLYLSRTSDGLMYNNPATLAKFYMFKNGSVLSCSGSVCGYPKGTTNNFVLWARLICNFYNGNCKYNYVSGNTNSRITISSVANSPTAPCAATFTAGTNSPGNVLTDLIC